MNKQSIIGLVLMFAVLLGFSYWQTSKTQKQRAAQVEQAVKEAAEAAKEAEATAALAGDSITPMPGGAETAPAPGVDAGNPFALATQGEAEYHTIKNEVYTVKFNTRGGRIAGITLNDYLTYKKEDLVLLGEDRSDFYLQFFAMNRAIRTDQCFFEWIAPEKDSVGGEDSLQVRMRLYPNTASEDGSGLVFDKSRYIEWVYTLYGNDYMLGIDLNMVNTQNLIAGNTNFIDLVWNAQLEQLEKARQMESMNTAIYYNPVTDKVRYLKENRDDRKSLTTPCSWFSFKQQFFSVSLIAEKEFPTAEIQNFTRKGAPEGYLKDLQATIGLPYGGNANEALHMKLYAGPNKYRTLRDYHLDLERQIPLGWSFFLMQWINRFAVIPVFDFLETKGINYGIIILILTILLKIVIFPFTYKSYVSSAKMRVVQPEVAAINEKYSKPEQAMDKQKATMNLYKKAGISPMSGCLPMLFQFPILIAMFRFFPASIELRQQPFLWADDLSSYDSILNLGFNIPFYGSHVSLFALLMAITNLLYTRMTMKQQNSNTMPGMKFMTYFMPIMFLGLLNSYSAALNYYYVLSTLITFLQMYIIRRFINDDKVRAIIQENKKKPVKKSKFQARLDAMMKQQEELARKQQRR